MSLLGLATLPAYSIMVALSAGIGLPYGPINPLLNYAMQTRSPGHLRGRVVGALTSLGYAAGPLGYVVAGPLVERLGVRPAFPGLTVLLLVIALATLGVSALRAFDEPPRYPATPEEPPEPAAPGPLPLAPAAEPSLRNAGQPGEPTAPD